MPEFESKADHVRYLLLNRGARTDEQIADAAGTTVGRVYKLKRELRRKKSIPKRAPLLTDVPAVPVRVDEVGAHGRAEGSNAPEGISLVRVELTNPRGGGGQPRERAEPAPVAGSVRCSDCGLVIAPPVPAACPRCGGG